MKVRFPKPPVHTSPGGSGLLGSVVAHAGSVQEHLQKSQGIIEQALEQLNPQAQAPAGGVQGGVAYKKSVRDYDMAWSTTLSIDPPSGQVTVGPSVTGAQLVLSGSLAPQFWDVANIPGGFSGGLTFVGGYSSPVRGRMFIGDGSGWTWPISKRTGGVTSDLFTFHDNGGEALTINDPTGGVGGAFFSFRTSNTEVGYIGFGTSIGGASAQDFGVGCDGTNGRLFLNSHGGVVVTGPNTGVTLTVKDSGATTGALSVTETTANGVAATATCASTAAHWQAATTLATALAINSVGTNWGQIGNVGTQFWALGSGNANNGGGTPANIALEWGSTGAALYVPNSTTSATGTTALINTATSPVGQIVRTSSSLRYKANVESVQPSDIDAVLQMRPVTYTSTSEIDDPTKPYLGFIAEEMALIDPRLVVWTPSQVQDRHPVPGCPMVPESIAYDRLTTLLVGAVQMLTQRVAALESQLAAANAPAAPSGPTVDQPAAPLTVSGSYGLTGTNVVTEPSVVTVTTTETP